MAVGLLGERKPSVGKMKDLKTALGAMIPAPDFEEYVRILLHAKDYKVAPNRVIQGFCVTHEIDGILEKDGETIYLEVKNHSNPHTSTPFNVTLAAKAKWDDIQRGYEKGLNEHSFDRVLIVCNTRLTKHADDYARCIGLDHVGWNVPKGAGARAHPSAGRSCATTSSHIHGSMIMAHLVDLTEVGWISVEGSLATIGAKVNVGSVALRDPIGAVRIDLHPAYWISHHLFTQLLLCTIWR